MIDFDLLSQCLGSAGLSQWAAGLDARIRRENYLQTHGDFERWESAVKLLPKVRPSGVAIDQAAVRIGEKSDLDTGQLIELEKSLRLLCPWRKGPYDVFGIHIDTEWRSDWKWARLVPHIQSLSGRRVLDVGCGSGYHCWRMAGAGAKLVVGIDPSLLFFMQFLSLQHFLRDARVWMLPVAIEDVPTAEAEFDTVFSMGVLYHRRIPRDHLIELFECLRPGGELVLETLVIEGHAGEVLVPDGRYAQMRNVWNIPSVVELQKWVGLCGFEDVRIVDVNVTSVEEQRSTEWMQFHSLNEFLDPADHGLTIEGYPAPRRAICLARRPG